MKLLILIILRGVNGAVFEDGSSTVAQMYYYIIFFTEIALSTYVLIASYYNIQLNAVAQLQNHNIRLNSLVIIGFWQIINSCLFFWAGAANTFVNQTDSLLQAHPTRVENRAADESRQNNRQQKNRCAFRYFANLHIVVDTMQVLLDR